MTIELQDQRAEALLKYFPPFGTLIVEPIVRDGIELFSMQVMNDTIAHLEINGFANYRYDLTFNPLNQVPQHRHIYVELTDRGRLVKHLGTFSKFDIVQRHELEQSERRQKLSDELLESNLINGNLTKRLYYVNLAIAVATVVAALYYSLEILKNHFEVSDCARRIFVFCVLSISIASIIWLRLEKTIENRKNNKSNSTTKSKCSIINIMLSRN